MFTEDLGAFFDVAAFGTAGTLAGAPVRGIFDRPGAEVSMGFGAAMGGRATYMLPSSTPGIAVGAVLTLGATAYTVAEVLPDGTGVTTLTLERGA